MTDEEKAEKFVKENCCEFCVSKDDCEMGCIDCHTKEGVLYGLTEGRKDRNCINCSNHSSNLRKENEGLKRNLKRYSEKIAEQEETIDAQDEKINFYISRMNKALTENEQLKKDKEWLDNTNNEQTEVILKLNEQIEKMKCCENCKWYKDNDCIGDIVCTDNDWNGWELAE